MHAKTLGDAQQESEQEEMAWNNDWDDNDSTGALESQHMLNPTRNSMLPDEEDDEIEDEIRVNLSSKIRSSLHAYKIAGIALIVVLISFTINTVTSNSFSSLNLGIRTIRPEHITVEKAILHAVSSDLGAFLILPATYITYHGY